MFILKRYLTLLKIEFETIIKMDGGCGIFLSVGENSSAFCWEHVHVTTFHEIQNPLVSSIWENTFNALREQLIQTCKIFHHLVGKFSKEIEVRNACLCTLLKEREREKWIDKGTKEGYKVIKIEV